MKAIKPILSGLTILTLSGCFTTEPNTVLPGDSNNSSQGTDELSPLATVRLNNLAMDQALVSPFTLGVSWQALNMPVAYTWQLLLDGVINQEGDQTQASVNLTHNAIAPGKHIIKLKLCSNGECIYSQPVLINVLASNTNDPGDSGGSDNSGNPDSPDDSGNSGNPDNPDNPDSPDDSGGTGNSGEPDDSENTESLQYIMDNYFAGEHPSAYLTDDGTLAFYDINRQGQPRVIRNDVQGNLPGMVQFVQSHAVNPNGNQQNNHPDVVAKRSALLLFTPTSQVEGALQVEGFLNGQSLGELPMKMPHQLPKSDYANGDGRPDLTYSKRAFHNILPWNWMQPGLKLVFSDNTNSSELAASNLQFAAPSQLVLHNIRLGMLTTPPVSDNHKLTIEPTLYATDYFQTLPISKLVNAQYQEIQLNRVIVNNGTIYDQVSADDGGVYSGDMRENVAKHQVSTGINLANWGISSSSNSEDNPQISARITMHHAQGNYQNGVQEHGLSGGAGIGTLYSSQGNELSHELGHNFGLGHYPGKSGDDVYWAAHHADSGWGYMGHRHRMRANVHWFAQGNGIDVGGIISSENFKHIYSYNKDAMSGGEITSAFSKYTHHTGYSANKIQEWFAPKWIADPSLQSGYKKWENNQFVAANTQGIYKKPTKVGVPVITLLGGYDPNANTQKAVLYPAFISNYGNVFNLNVPNVATNQCGIDIQFENGDVETIALQGSRLKSSIINQFQVNIEASRKPTQANLYCFNNGNKNPLAQLSISTDLPNLAPPVIVGEEQGYEQLRTLELARLENALLQFNSGKQVVLSNELLTIVNAWENTSQLSASAQVILDEYKAGQDKIKWLTAWVNKQDGNINKTQLTRLLADLKLSTLTKPAGAAIVSDRNQACLSLQADLTVTVQTGSCDKENQQWFMDNSGKIHSVQQPQMCLTSSTSGSMVSLCENLAASTWQVHDDKSISNNAFSGKCLDFASPDRALMYSCHGNDNQKWSAPTVDNQMLMGVLPGALIEVLIN